MTRTIESICSDVEILALDKSRDRVERIQDLEHLSYQIDLLYQQIDGQKRDLGNEMLKSPGKGEWSKVK